MEFIKIDGDQVEYKRKDHTYKYKYQSNDLVALATSGKRGSLYAQKILMQEADFQRKLDFQENGLKIMQGYMDLVCNYFGVYESTIKGRDRQRYIVLARRVLTLLLIDTKKFTLVQIGDFLNRHHSTIIHNEIEGRYDYKHLWLFKNAYETISNDFNID